MSEEMIDQRLIGTRGRAIAVLCFVAYLAGMRLWRFVQHRAEKSAWIYPTDSWLPNWVAVPLNVFTYGMFVAFLVVVLYRWRGSERVIVAVLIAQILVSPLRQYLSLSMAATMLWIQAFAALVMFLAALSLYLRLSAQPRSTGVR